jgi:serine protease Do
MGPRERMPFTRRAALSAIGTTTLVSLAGCVVSSAADRPAASGTATGSPTETVTATPDDSSYSKTTIRRAREVGLAIRDSVVAMSPRPPRVRGTGWYFRSEDLVVTAGHVVAARDGWVGWQPDGTKLDLTYLDDAYVDGADVGAMRTEIPGLPLSAGDADALEPGQPLVQVGHPGGVGNWVIALGRYLGETDTEADGLLTSIPSAGGASGAPTVTLDGEVVGLLSGGEFVEASGNGRQQTTTPVYGPDDRPERGEHVGIDAIVDRVEGWTDAG